MQKIITALWLGLLGLVVATLAIPASRDQFVHLTRSWPFLMGIGKIALLGTMGELLGGRIVTGAWRLSGIRIHQRILVWAFLGAVFTVVFPLFSFGVEGLLYAGLLPGRGHALAHAFWKSLFMNLLFGYPMMIFHRVTDTLIDRGRLFSRWPLVDIFTTMNWSNMIRLVGGALFWFWIPAHTGTFLLPAEFRVVTAALLSVALGIILGVAKKLSLKTPA